MRTGRSPRGTVNPHQKNSKILDNRARPYGHKVAVLGRWRSSVRAREGRSCCLGTRSRTPTGTGSRTCCPDDGGSTGASPGTTGGSSTPSCTWPGPASRGRTCPSGWGTPTARGGGSTGGPRRAAGTRSWRPCGTRAWTCWSSTPPPSAPTRARPGQKKVGRDWRPGRPGAWPQPGRVRHQDSREVRRPGPPGRTEADGRPGVGHRPGRGDVGRPRAGRGDRGQGVRQEGPGRTDRVSGCGGGHSDAEDPGRAAGGGPAPVPGAEPVRAVLVEGQAVPAGGDALRQEGGQLPGVREGGRHHGDVEVSRTSQVPNLVSIRPSPNRSDFSLGCQVRGLERAWPARVPTQSRGLGTHWLRSARVPYSDVQLKRGTTEV